MSISLTRGVRPRHGSDRRDRFFGRKKGWVFQSSHAPYPCSTYDYFVFDACYFKNGQADCVRVSGPKPVNYVRFSGCIFELENNYYAHAGDDDYGSTTSHSALTVVLDVGNAGYVVQGCTILLGDHWPDAQGNSYQAMIRVAPHPDDTTWDTSIDVAVKNLLVVHDVPAPAEFKGPFVLVPSEAHTADFEGNLWPEITNQSIEPFRIGRHEFDYNPTEWNFFEWRTGGTAGTYTHANDDEESYERVQLEIQGFRPRNTIDGQPEQPEACDISFELSRSFRDYYGRRFQHAGRVTGAALPCVADHDLDGVITGADVIAFNEDLANGSLNADLDLDGDADGDDEAEFEKALLNGCNP